jgi:hypothetical protein
VQATTRLGTASWECMVAAAADLPTGMVSDFLEFFSTHHVASTPH